LIKKYGFTGQVTEKQLQVEIGRSCANPLALARTVVHATGWALKRAGVHGPHRVRESRAAGAQEEGGGTRWNRRLGAGPHQDGSKRYRSWSSCCCQTGVPPHRSCKCGVLGWFQGQGGTSVFGLCLDCCMSVLVSSMCVQVPIEMARDGQRE